MGRKKAPEGQSGEMEPALESDAPAGESISKMEAVRRTLNQGVENPTDGSKYVREHYGLDVNNGMFSAYKAQIRNKKKPGSAAGFRGRGRPPAVPLQPNRLYPGRSDNALLAAQQVKDLIDRYGLRTVRGLVELFSHT